PEYPQHWGRQHGFDVYTSTDLVNWSAPKSIFERQDGFWGEEEFWAPEELLTRWHIRFLKWKDMKLQL
ncbi:MAG: hypothetical protein J6R98_03050, partial [Bacteroidaceae bacterium]|nr:hypothetical protein [Bacteroidaceae bacterium]